MWMHNGNIGAWRYVKRPLSDSLSDKWFLGVKGGTDSEWAFALFLDTLEGMGVNPDDDPEKGFGAKILRKALKQTIAKINAFVKAVPAEHNLGDVETRSLLNFAITDGHSVIVSRYVSSKTDAAASLYYSSGTEWAEGKVKGQFRMERRDKASDVVLVASEPLTFERHNWLSVPTNTIVTITDQTVFVRPVKDEYYDPDPSTERSTGFAKSQGLVSKAPGGGTETPVQDDTVERPQLDKVCAPYVLSLFGDPQPIHSGRSSSPVLDDVASRGLVDKTPSSSPQTPGHPRNPKLTCTCHRNNRQW